MDDEVTHMEAWQRVEQAHARYEEALRELPLHAPEFHLYRQEYIAAVAEHRAVLQRDGSARRDHR